MNKDDKIVQFNRIPRPVISKSMAEIKEERDQRRAEALQQWRDAWKTLEKKHILK